MQPLQQHWKCRADKGCTIHSEHRPVKTTQWGNRQKATAAPESCSACQVDKAYNWERRRCPGKKNLAHKLH
jgi:hypothetical protein